MMSKQALSQLYRSVRRSSTTPQISQILSSRSFGTPETAPEALSSLLPSPAQFANSDHSTSGQLISRPFQCRAPLSTAASPFQTQSQVPGRLSRVQGLGLWLVAGAAPVCLFSTLISSAAKEKGPVELLGDVVLYQYEACPFCNKVKAYLDYRNIPYRVVEVNPLSKKELKWSDYKKVPVLLINEKQLNDSTAIISFLEEKVCPHEGGKAVPIPKRGEEEGEGEEMDEETRWRKWVDGHLVHLLSPNIYRSPSEAMEAFEYITTNGKFSFMERTMAKYAGAVTMYFISKKLKKRHHIDNEREALYNAANEWVAAVGGRKFLGGGKPNLADLAVFGVLRPIRHLASGKDMIANSRIGPWYESMEVEVGESCRLETS